MIYKWAIYIIAMSGQTTIFHHEDFGDTIGIIRHDEPGEPGEQ